MENENKQNQGNKQKHSDGILTLLQPHDMSKTVESAMHVFQGRHEKLPELLHDVGTLILKGARKLSTAQLVLAAGAVTVGAVFLAKYVAENGFELGED